MSIDSTSSAGNAAELTTGSGEQALSDSSPDAHDGAAGPSIARPFVSTTSRLARLVIGISYVLAAVGVQSIRHIGSPPLWRTVWAEDGQVFYAEALRSPLYATALRSYAGYSHFYSRIIAEIATWLPITWFAAWACFAAFTTTALLSLYLFHVSAPLLRSPVRQGALALSIVLLPTLPGEILGAYSNLHWMWPLPVVLTVLFPPTSRWLRVVGVVMVFIAPLSSPLAVVAAPVALWRLISSARHRHRRREATYVVILDVVYSVATIVQLVIRTTSPQLEQPDVSFADKVTGAIRLYALQVTDTTVFGARLPLDWLPTMRWWLPAISAFVVATILTLKCAVASKYCRRWIAGFAGASFLIYAYTVFGRPSLVSVLAIPLADYYNGPSRYEIVPQLLLFVALLIPMDSPQPATSCATPSSAGRRRRAASWVGLAAALLPVVAIATSLRQSTHRTWGLEWPAQVELAQEACAQSGSATADVTITPPGWEVEISCDRLEAG